MYRIGIDLGGTNIAVGLVNEQTELVKKKSVPTGATRPAEEIIADMAAVVLSLCEDCAIDLHRDVESVGIAAPGAELDAVLASQEPKVLNRLINLETGSLAVEAGIMGYEMTKAGCQFYGGDGIVTKGVENTIRNVGRLARDGMSETDKEIIRIMLGKTDC